MFLGAVLPAVGWMHQGRHDRRSPIECLPFQKVTVTTGLKSRARVRASQRRVVDIWLNRVISMLHQLASGVLNDELLATDSGDWLSGPPRCVPRSESGQELAEILRVSVAQALERRPADFPSGVAALERQRGVASTVPGPQRGKGRGKSKPDKLSGKIPNRGDIWPAVISDIALPPPGTKAIPLTQISPQARHYLEDYHGRMLRPLEERTAIDAEDSEAPFVDPAIRRDIMGLALRMARGGMLLGVEKSLATLGLFTVVKRVITKDEMDEHGNLKFSAGTIIQRLVFDQRVPNRKWLTPPWVPLGGPGALASIDVSTEDQDTVPEFWVCAGDIPDYYHRL